MSFWDKDQWKSEIDRIADEGYNVALVTAGLPKVWQLVLRDLGYTEDEIAAYIPDEAAQAWWNMGNLEGLGGPLSIERIDADADLGRFICSYMHSKGIEPILNGFVGLVPSTEVKYSPGMVIDQGNWCAKFKRPDVIDPRTPRFERFARTWYCRLEEVYGFKPKYLGGDLFHEGGKTEGLAPEDITATVRKVQGLMQEYFPGVVWVLQGWQNNPKPVIRDGLDPKFSLIEYLDGNMNNVDLPDPGYGKFDWVWCEILNFGGTTELHGGIRRFRNVNNAAASNVPQAKTLRGFGMLDEGLETNTFCYAVYADPDIDAGEWLSKRYSYGSFKLPDAVRDDLAAAIGLVCETAWNCPFTFGCHGNVFCAEPAFHVKSVTTWGSVHDSTPYDLVKLEKAAAKYLAAAKGTPALLDCGEFRRDMVELFMQVHADHARLLLQKTELDPGSRAKFLKMLELADELASCAKEYRLDWQESRRVKTAGGQGIRGYRRLITTWTGDYDSSIESGLHEYAHRAYAGLLRHYYLPRWRAFYDWQEGRVTEGQYRDFARNHANSFPGRSLPPTADADLVVTAERVMAK